LLLIPTGALCIANGVRWIAFSLGGHSARRTPLAIGEIAAIAALVVVSSTQLTQRFDQVTQPKQKFDQVRAAYGGLASLELPGAEDVHVEPKGALRESECIDELVECAAV
jgi:hypothetical protein